VLRRLGLSGSIRAMSSNVRKLDAFAAFPPERAFAQSKFLFKFNGRRIAVLQSTALGNSS
jgi:hypothetical protein